MYLNKKLSPRQANLEKPNEQLLLYFQYKNGPQHSDYKHDKLLDYRLSLLEIILRLLHSSSLPSPMNHAQRNFQYKNVPLS